MRVPRYLEYDRTSRRMPNQRAAAKISMAITEPTAVAMFDLFQVPTVWVFGSLLKSHFRRLPISNPESAKDMPLGIERNYGENLHLRRRSYE